MLVRTFMPFISGSTFYSKCDELIKKWPIYIHSHWTRYFYLNILNSTSVAASQWALNVYTLNHDTSLLKQHIFPRDKKKSIFGRVMHNFVSKSTENQIKYFINLILISIEILVQDGINEFENDVLIQQIQNANFELNGKINIKEKFDTSVMKIVEMMTAMVDIADMSYNLFEIFFKFFVDLIEMPHRMWRGHGYSYSYNYNYNEELNVQLINGAQFVKVFDQEVGEHGKWTIGQIFAISYNNEKNCRQFQVFLRMLHFAVCYIDFFLF